jgi:hypothetical protein
MKTIYKLKPDFIQHFDSPDDLIVWVYRWNTKVLVSDELHRLFTNHLNLN